MPGYSGTPLVKKLGIKPGCRMVVDQGPDDYVTMVSPLPEGVTFVPPRSRKVDVVHLFTREAEELAAKLEKYRHQIVDNGVIWVSWPKKAAKVPTDITEDVIREVAFPLGLVDIKVCAVDDVWSGLKLVIRVENRKGSG
jgi:hypothetical protein